MKKINRINPSKKSPKKVAKTDAQLIDALKLYQIELEMQNKDLIEIQKALQDSHDKYADLYNLAPIAYFTCNQDGLIIDVNQSGLNLLGLNKKMTIGRSFSRYIAPEFQLLFSAHRKLAFKSGNSVTLEIKLLRWSEPPIDVQLDCKVVDNASSREKQLLICIANVAQRKIQDNASHLQRIRISSSERAQSIQEQISSITDSQSHSLTVINNYIQGCIRRLESNQFKRDEVTEMLKKAMLQSDVLAGIFMQFKDFSNKYYFRYESADINKIIHDSILLINHEIIEYPVSVQFEPVNDFPSVKIDVSCIQQVLLNLARNSFEAMRDAKTREPKLSIEISLSNSNSLEISMIDNGPGFKQENAERLFEPNYTTKKYALGLGLSVSRMIIHKHGGELNALPHPAGGAWFQLTLPCVVNRA